jgi:hypothetical protein
MLRYYTAEVADLGNPVSEDFAEVFDLCAMQRLMQALGAYGFLGIVKDRSDFLRHISPAIHSLHEVLGRIHGLEELRTLVGRLAAR